MHVYWPVLVVAAILVVIGVAIVRDPEGARRDQQSRMVRLFGDEAGPRLPGSSRLFAFVGWAFVTCAVLIAVVSLFA